MRRFSNACESEKRSKTGVNQPVFRKKLWRKRMMTKFEVGKMYQGVIERTGAVRYFEVVRRTPKFITIRGEMVCSTEKIRVKESDGIETAQYDCAWRQYNKVCKRKSTGGKRNERRQT